MAYSPENNPYIPGDPYSYDLKWIVREIKKLSANYSTIDDKINAAVIAAYQEHGEPVIFSSAADMIAAELEPGSLAYITGYYSPGDAGNNLYFITDDYSIALSARYYIAFSGGNKWACAVILNTYVVPEMYGAKADGITDDSAAIKNAVDHNDVIMFTPGKSYKVMGPINNLHDNMLIDGRGATIINGFAGNAFTADTNINIGNITIQNITFVGAGKNNPLGTWPHVNSAVVIATRKHDISVINCRFYDFNYAVFIGGEEGYDCNIKDCFFKNCKSAIDTFAIDRTIISGCEFYSCTEPIQIEPNAGIWTENTVITNCSTFNSESYSINLHARNRKTLVTNCNFDNTLVMTDGTFENCSIQNCVINSSQSNKSMSFGGDTIITNCIIYGGTVMTLLSGWTGIFKSCIIYAVGTHHAFYLGSGKFTIISCSVFLDDNYALIQNGGSEAVIIDLYLPAGRIPASPTYTKTTFSGFIGAQWPGDEISRLDPNVKYYNTPNSQ